MGILSPGLRLTIYQVTVIEISFKGSKKASFDYHLSSVFWSQKLITLQISQITANSAPSSTSSSPKLVDSGGPEELVLLLAIAIPVEW
mmetsp:Transcript_6954/g.9089  ORF Transcript_6954/g.9089 Transcript_6954/m.9089 type:complete len:88 (-) Transcript_6954:1211-1474(-)